MLADHCLQQTITDDQLRQFNDNGNLVVRDTRPINCGDISCRKQR